MIHPAQRFQGVILATGDNSGDEKIMKHFAPEIVEKKIDGYAGR